MNYTFTVAYSTVHPRDGGYVTYVEHKATFPLGPALSFANALKKANDTLAYKQAQEGDKFFGPRIVALAEA